MTYIALILSLLLIKHWYVDFVAQTDSEIKFKGVYGNWEGIKHSLKHAVGTGLIMSIVDYKIGLASAVLDGLLHYHVDYLKSSVNTKLRIKPNQKMFWATFGLDQLAHQLTYVLIIWLWIIQYG